MASIRGDEFYNIHKGLTRDERRHSKISNLRYFNNAIKRSLITQYGRSHDRVFDMCCGRGGDLAKWMKLGVSFYLGLDVSSTSITEARARNEENKEKTRAEFRVADCMKDHLDLTRDAPFDIVSCQFALHYAFSSRDRALTCLGNVARHLKPGGYFICTTVDEDTLRGRVRRRGGAFGNDLYKIEFDAKTKLPRQENEKFELYGAAYDFSLVESVETCTEYVVRYSALIDCCIEVGLEFVDNPHFSKMEREARRDMTRQEDEIARLYTAFVFRKK